jgi:hypothetical protein
MVKMYVGALELAEQMRRSHNCPLMRLDVIGRGEYSESPQSHQRPFLSAISESL